MEKMICPRCNGEDFKEIDCGSDTYNDDITYTSEICKNCGLYHSGWTDKWLMDCETWLDEDTAEEYNEGGK